MQPASRPTIHYDLEKKKLVREAAKSAKNGPVNADGMFSFAGIDDQYFTAAFLPPPNTTLADHNIRRYGGCTFNNAEEPYPGVAVGGAARNQFGIYVGPKEINALHRVNPKLDGIVDWGLFGIIAKPLFLVLHWLNDQLVHNYGWAIILMTVIINIALFPLKLTNLKSMRKMQALQPEMAKINEKYKGISMSDPRAANKQQEMMELYKKHGVNPMGGCIPMLIQMPFLYAFYKVLAVSIELRHAQLALGRRSFAARAFRIRFLPLIMVVTSFVHAENDAHDRRRPEPAENHAVHAADVGFFFCQPRAGWCYTGSPVIWWGSHSSGSSIRQQAPVTVRDRGEDDFTKDGRKRA